MKTYGEVKVELHAILISAVDVGEWSAPRSGRFTLGEIDKRLGGPQSRSWRGDEKKSLHLLWIEPVQPVA
jgi:hypothetical protein